MSQESMVGTLIDILGQLWSDQIKIREKLSKIVGVTGEQSLMAPGKCSDQNIGNRASGILMLAAFQNVSSPGLTGIRGISRRIPIHPEVLSGIPVWNCFMNPLAERALLSTGLRTTSTRHSVSEIIFHIRGWPGRSLSFLRSAAGIDT